MTYKEVIKRLKYINNFDSLCQESHEALNIVIKVLELHFEKPIQKYNNSWEEDWYINEYDIQGEYDN